MHWPYSPEVRRSVSNSVLFELSLAAQLAFKGKVTTVPQISRSYISNLFPLYSELGSKSLKPSDTPLRELTQFWKEMTAYTGFHFGTLENGLLRRDPAVPVTFLGELRKEAATRGRNDLANEYLEKILAEIKNQTFDVTLKQRLV